MASLWIVLHGIFGQAFSARAPSQHKARWLRWHGAEPYVIHLMESRVY